MTSLLCSENCLFQSSLIIMNIISNSGIAIYNLKDDGFGLFFLERVLKSCNSSSLKLQDSGTSGLILH